MKLLEERILRDGKVFPGNILKVDSFLNHQIDVGLLCEIGKEITNMLNEKGINTLHIYDTSGSSLYESKKSYEEKINEALEMYPSISYIFDISRSVCMYDDLSIKNEWVMYENLKVPTIQLLCGTSTKKLTKVQEKSLAFANVLAQSINKDDIPLISEIIVSKYSLAQSFPRTTLRVDIGSFASTYEDAIITANIFADGIIELLNN